jgi:hypothetical protein
MDVFTPDMLYRAHVDERRQQYRCLERVLAEQLEARRPSLHGALNQLRSALLASLEQLDQTTEGERWRLLAEREDHFRRWFSSVLDLVNGLAVSGGLGENANGFDDGFSALAEEWLAALNARAGVDGRPLVIPGLGRLLSSDAPLARGVVHLPFLDWDLWHLPLLARATGLLLHLEDKWGRVAQLKPQLLAQNGQEARSDWLVQLAAEMTATALVGPAYAIASVTLDFNYSRRGLSDPAVYNGEWRPAAAERAVSMLATLERMDQHDAKAPYARIRKKLESFIQDAFASAGQRDLLARTREEHAARQQQVMDQLVMPSVRAALPETAARWQSAEPWYCFLTGQTRERPTWSQMDEPLVTAVVTALWRHRLEYPDKALLAHQQLFAIVLKREGSLHTWIGEPAPPAAMVVEQARLDRLDLREERLARILEAQAIEDQDRKAISGRFKQWISLNQSLKRSVTAAEPARPDWPKIATLEGAALPLQHEALGFLGGLLLRYHGLDVEDIARGIQGPALGDLASALLTSYQVHTGVKWGGLVVLGSDPFLASWTDIIQVRFLDWSPWNLPLMAHEFGHLVARDNTEFQVFKKKKTFPGESERWVEEIFADVFATYMAGPALACSAILLQFAPGWAFKETETHPPFDQRTAAIIKVLDHLQLAAGSSRWPSSNPARLLENSWRQIVPDSAVTNEMAQARQRACVKAEECLAIVERWYSRSEPYSAKRWAAAQRLARDLEQLATTNPDRLRPLLDKHQLSLNNLDDLLNGLWCARLDATVGGYYEPTLEANAYQLARLVQARGESNEQ